MMQRCCDHWLVREKALRPSRSRNDTPARASIEIVDLGIVELWIDGAPVTRRLRRKVLGLLCFVSSSNRAWHRTRDEALEALWPDLAPRTAVNSLHQTIYFLRRLLDPDYREGVGARIPPLRRRHRSAFDRRPRGLRKLALLAAHRAVLRHSDQVDDNSLSDIPGQASPLDFSYEEWASRVSRQPSRGMFSALSRGRSPVMVGSADPRWRVMDRPTGLGSRSRLRTHRAAVARRLQDASEHPPQPPSSTRTTRRCCATTWR